MKPLTQAQVRAATQAMQQFRDCLEQMRGAANAFNNNMCELIVTLEGAMADVDRAMGEADE